MKENDLFFMPRLKGGKLERGGGGEKQSSLFFPHPLKMKKKGEKGEEQERGKGKRKGKKKVP